MKPRLEIRRLRRENVKVLRGHEGGVSEAGFAPAGDRIVSGGYDGTVRLWDAASGAELKVLRGHAGGVSAARFAPAGDRIVSGGEDGTVRLWDAASGAELKVLRSHEAWFSAAGFAPAGDRIVSGGSDGTVRLWFIGKDDAALVAHACALLPRDLAPEAIQRFNLDPNAPWPCAERAITLWPHPVAAAIEPASGPAEGAGAAVPQ